jgi:hypothetical protein
MDCGRFLVRPQCRQPLQEGRHLVGRAGHDGLNCPPGAVGIAGQRQDQGPHPWPSRIALGQQRPEGGDGFGLVAGYGEAQRQTPPGFVGIGAGQDGAIVSLRFGVAAEEIIGEPAVEAEA